MGFSSGKKLSKVLKTKAEEISDLIAGIEGIGDKRVEATSGLPQLTVEYDRASLARFGVNVNQLNQLLKTAFAGSKAGVVFEGEKRFDVVVAGTNASIALLVECKAPSVPITQATFDQIARYQLAVKATYLMLTNGLQHIYCQIDATQQSYQFIPEFPLNQLQL